jgi:hypothetical protein
LVDAINNFGLFSVSAKTLNKNAWTEQQEDEVIRLAAEFKEKITADKGRIGRFPFHL